MSDPKMTSKMQKKWSGGHQILKVFMGGHAPNPTTRKLTSSALENISSQLLPGTWHLCEMPRGIQVRGMIEWGQKSKPKKSLS